VLLLFAFLSVCLSGNVDVTVGAGGNAFNPTSVDVVAGDTVTFLFQASGHDVVVQTGGDSLNCAATTSAVDSCSWTNNTCDTSMAITANSGDSWVYPSSAADVGKTFSVFCSIHCVSSGMAMTFNVAAPAGTFTIVGLVALVVALLRLVYRD